MIFVGSFTYKHCFGYENSSTFTYLRSVQCQVSRESKFSQYCTPVHKYTLQVYIAHICEYAKANSSSHLPRSQRSKHSYSIIKAHSIIRNNKC